MPTVAKPSAICSHVLRATNGFVPTASTGATKNTTRRAENGFARIVVRIVVRIDRKDWKVFSSDRRLNDGDVMPWGKHEGELLSDVPDDYWQFFLRQPWCDNWPDLVQYANTIVEDD